MSLLALRCSYCGSSDHPPLFCPTLPDDARAELRNVGDRTDVAGEWGDWVTLWTSANRDEEAIFLSVYDDDARASATAALNVEEAARLGAELTAAAYVKRGHQ